MSEERDPSPDRDGTEYSPVHDDHGYLVKLLGIPLLSTADEIKEFLQRKSSAARRAFPELI